MTDRITVRGVDLHVDHRPGTGTPLVLCNGIGANLELLEPLVDALAGQAGRRIPVIRFDVPGTGGSPVTRPHRMRGLARLVRGVVERFGYSEADVLGISWGGALAQETARRHPDLIRRVVLCATSMGMVMVPARPRVLFTLASPTRYFRPSRTAETGSRIYGGGFGDDRELADRFARATRAPDPLGYYGQIFAGWGWTSAHYLPLMRQPVLVVAGDDDPIIPLVNARMMAALLPDATVHVVRGGGHLALLTRSRELVPVIHRFLTEGEQ
ncbi:poly(3-hydroxyalkanoate) depolymerase [Amycolatopsis keratiniphila]|uniref:poly(3-hydroxyalkanoate) depolymerase n=1 Tax=Amycolatopsis keratiniphila TaxID=129921 RepID=UPI000907A5DD|nr:poly(3-hydroxyalkanoate) depolymerase [Amycolatopsis keratiniphila]OLZ50201.1 poly(3-hydroxyalkanoate) depolymerase [Amycolatopsis keratiniphila subsp. nogabecina]